MSPSRKELSENLLKLNGNSHWHFYVRAVESKYESLLESFLNSDQPDEAMRGEIRAYWTLLKQIKDNNGTPT